MFREFRSTVDKSNSPDPLSSPAGTAQEGQHHEQHSDKTPPWHWNDTRAVQHTREHFCRGHGPGSAGLRVNDDLKGLLQPKWFCGVQCAAFPQHTGFSLGSLLRKQPTPSLTARELKTASAADLQDRLEKGAFFGTGSPGGCDGAAEGESWQWKFGVCITSFVFVVTSTWPP